MGFFGALTYLFIPHSGIQISIKQVDEEIDPHHHGGEKHVDAGDHRVVPVRKRREHQTTQPRQVENVLHDHGASDQDRQLQADQGDDRDEGILDGMPDDHDPLPEPLGPGGADIVLPQHLQHHGARHAHGGSGHGRPQNQAGDQKHLHIPQRVFAERNQPHRRRPAPPDGRVDHHHNAQPEVGRGQADDSDRAPQVIGGGILANRRINADGKSNQKCDEDGQETQLDGDRQSSYDLLLDRPGAQQGIAEGAVQENTPQPAAILHVDRYIQSQGMQKNLTVQASQGIMVSSYHGVDDVARDETHREKNDDAQEKQGGDDQQQPPDNIGSHGMYLIGITSVIATALSSYGNSSIEKKKAFLAMIVSSHYSTSKGAGGSLARKLEPPGSLFL